MQRDIMEMIKNIIEYIEPIEIRLKKI